MSHYSCYVVILVCNFLNFFRFILDTFFYCLFLVFILHSVLDGIGNSKNEEATWSLNIVALWVFCYILRDLKNMVRCSVQNRDKNLVSFRFGYDLTLHILLSIAIVFKVCNIVMYQ